MIQIDMPMPTNCLDCPACNEYLMCAIPVNGRKWGGNDVREFGQGRPEWCPMKEQEADMIALKNAYKELAEKGSVIVRCKDCKKCDLPEEEPYEDGFCSRCGYVKMDFFCADGVKKDE